MSAFTPGPWSLESYVLDHGGWRDSERYIRVTAGATLIASYSLEYAEYPASDAECEANARLIACAPDFYTEALRLVERHDEAVRKVDLEHCSCENCTPFRALIARANGEKV